MTLTNLPDLAQVREMTVAQVADLPVDHLAILLEDAAEIRDDGQAFLNKLNDALSEKYAAAAQEKRADSGKDTGRVSLDDGEYIVRADLPKKVDWDQAKLQAAIAVIRDEWKDDPAGYVTTKVVIEEKRYEAWPPMIRTLFQPARTVGTGKPTYKIERRAG